MIDPHSGEWDEELLRSIFNPVDVHRILQIQLRWRYWMISNHGTTQNLVRSLSDQRIMLNLITNIGINGIGLMVREASSCTIYGNIVGGCGSLERSSILLGKFSGVCYHAWEHLWGDTYQRQRNAQYVELVWRIPSIACSHVVEPWIFGVTLG